MSMGSSSGSFTLPALAVATLEAARVLVQGMATERQAGDGQRPLLGTAAAGCPALLVRRGGPTPALQGWSIIVPAHWVMPLWQALVYAGEHWCWPSAVAVAGAA